MTRISNVLLAVGIITFAGISLALDDEAKKKLEAKIAEWEKIGQNYEAAANSQSEQAEYCLAIATDCRKKEYVYETERKANMFQAGSNERKAGELLVAALGNTDKASEAWQKASSEAGRLGNDDRELELRKLAQDLRNKAIEIAQKAASAFENAAEALNSSNGKNLELSAQSSERAAQIRTQIASRL